MAENRTYIAIDLKSFYASVECQDRKLNPLTANLVVADLSRTSKTICLAVSPSLKKLGIPGRPRLFEVKQKIAELNRNRLSNLKTKTFTNEDWNSDVLEQHPDYKITYVIAKPRMAKYLEYSARIHQIYLRYIAAEDIHVYSIDEVMMDVTEYLRTYQMSARQLAQKMIQDVLKETGITATAGIGTNLYLAKVAMDIIAKYLPADEYGVRIGELDELSYRKQLWNHRPLTDFWRIGRGYANKLEKNGMYTMGDVARCSIGSDDAMHNEELLYKLFGINAELLIDHAWGYESCTMDAIKHYQPTNHSFSSGQVLVRGYTFTEAKLIAKEMADQLTLDLVAKGMTTKQIGIMIGYDTDCLKNISDSIDSMDLARDWYGRVVPKPVNGSIRLTHHTSSTKLILKAVGELYDKLVNHNMLVRRVNITFMSILSSQEAKKRTEAIQLNLFMSDHDEVMEEEDDKEYELQKAILSIKNKFGKNKLVKGRDLQEEATMMERNNQIGGHKA